MKSENTLKITWAHFCCDRRWHNDNKHRNQFELELICVKWSCLPLSVLIKLWVLCFNDYVRWFVNLIRKKECSANSLVAPDAKQLQHKRCDLACMFSNKWIVFTINFERTELYSSHKVVRGQMMITWSRHKNTTHINLKQSSLPAIDAHTKEFSFWEFRHSIEEETQTNSIRCKKKSESDFFLVEWENRIMHMRLNSWNDLWNEKIHTKRWHQRKEEEE